MSSRKLYNIFLKNHFSSISYKDLEKLILQVSLCILKWSASKHCLWTKVTFALKQIIVAQMEVAEDKKGEQSSICCSR